MSTIAAISTPLAAGGIGVIRISGERAIEIASRCFRPFHGRPVSEMKGYTAAYGSVFDETGEIDDGVLTVFRAPKSYTGENTAEISCHGGLLILQKTLRLVLSLGAQPAGPGEFTKRAFLNGKMDLAQAESVMRLISAQGELALSAARGACRGTVSRQIDAICQKLIETDAALAAWADYPDEDIPAVEPGALADTLRDCAGRLGRLIGNYDNGRAATEGVNTVICGKPNVGKSTLMNLLSGGERSIVTEIAGTTRDVVEQTVRLGDIVLRLSDTAGIRETDEPVEQIGVERAKEKTDEAELVLLVLDRSRETDAEDLALLRRTQHKNRIVILNKCDRPAAFSVGSLPAAAEDCVSVSAKDASAVDALLPVILRKTGAAGLDFTEGLLSSERQRQCCENARASLLQALEALETGITADAVTVDVDAAIDALLTLTGKKAGEAVVEEVFRSFCVGK